MRRFSVHSLRSRVWVLGIVLAVGLAAAGCKKTVNVGITMSPTTATVLVGTTSQFTATASNGGTVNWSVNGTANGNTTVGTVSSTGLYTAPLSVPPNTTITVTATLQADSSITTSATVTLDSGVRVNITPTSFTLGTSETLQFSAIVTGVPLNASRQPSGTSGDLGCNAISAPPTSVPYCNTVTWTVTPTTAAGTINANSGIYTAPSSATTAVITATSVFDTSRTGTASISIVQATPPTLSSISPNTAARGSLLQDVYLTGTNFLSTTGVFVNGTPIPGSNVLVPQPGLTTSPNSTVGTLMHIRLSDLTLATPPVPPATSTSLTFSVAPQGANTTTPCTNNAPALCQFSLTPVRPAVVGTSPDSIPQGSGSPVAFSINGGFFGTTQNPTVTAFYNGSEAKFPAVSSTNSTRQLTVTIGGSGNAGDVSTPGLFPVAITSNANPGASVVTNIAIQPSYPASSISQLIQFGNSATGGNVGTSPSAVAINTATGVAVVANQGSNDVELIDLTKTTPAVIGFICTASVASGSSISPTETGACPASGPVSVAVDNVADVALVANAAPTANTIALVDLTTSAQKVLQVLAAPNNNSLATPAPFVPFAVGVNPLNHIGIVAYQSTNVASLLTVLPTTPPSLAFSGVVNTSTGASPRVSVSQRLDWALVTPGGLGSLSVVDLARQTINTISSASRTAGIATITTSTAQNVRVGTPVLISNVGSGFDGVYEVQTIPSSTTFTYSQANQTGLSNATITGGNLSAVSYGFPVATLATSTSMQGVAFNDQTQKAILTDPAGSTPGSVFAALDQTSTTIPLPTTNVGDTNFNLATAVNPLANLAVSVNEHTGDVFVIDPNAPAVLTTIPAEGVNPVDVAIDPAANIAVFANQGAPSSISIYSLGAIRPLQILQTSVAPTPNLPPAPQPCPTATGPIVAGPSILVCSTFTSGTSASAVEQLVTIVGGGFTNSSKARLDGQVLATDFVSNREIRAHVTAAFQSVPRRYSLDVADSGAVSNSTSLAVVQSVNLANGNPNSSSCHTPSPQAVAVDPQLNEALVTDSGLGCKEVYLINLGNSSIQTVNVGTTPQGVAVSPRLRVAVVANQGDNTASAIDETTASTAGTVTLDNGPTGVAIDEDLGQAVVTATSANLADQFSVARNNSTVSVGTSSSLTVQQNPTAVAVDSVTHFAAVGNVTSANVTVVSLSNSAVSNSTSTIQIPQGIAIDPCPASACNANQEFLPNPNFLITASLQNQVEALDPTNGVLTPLRVGINPTALAYNPLASTLVTVNTLSQTMTVVDYLSKQVRAVFPVTTSNQFGVAIMPQTNLAVVADPTNSRVLLFPLPY